MKESGQQPSGGAGENPEPRRPGVVAPERRAKRPREHEAFEREDADFFQRVAEGYRRRVAAEPQRFVRIDADRPREQVAAQLEAALAARGW